MQIAYLEECAQNSVLLVTGLLAVKEEVIRGCRWKKEHIYITSSLLE